jgi:AcrR family transcriptional regulator
MVFNAETALILPAKQARSRATRDRLLTAGRELLNDGAFEETSIAQIAAEAGCSVGAFYQRFPDKERFFSAVVDTVLADIIAEADRFATSRRMSKASVEVALSKMVSYWVQVFRRHRGLFRTAIKKTLYDEAAWNPIRHAGITAVQPFISLLATKCNRSSDVGFHYRALAGFQILGGVMLNASLHPTVLLNLDSEELIAWANETMRHCLFDALPVALLAYGASGRPKARRKGLRN